MMRFLSRSSLVIFAILTLNSTLSATDNGFINFEECPDCGAVTVKEGEVTHDCPNAPEEEEQEV